VTIVTGDGLPARRSGDRDRLVSELTHVVGRTRAFMGELAASERELALMGEPHAAAVLRTMAAVREEGREGSLAAIERTAADVLKLLTASG
jgi:hypothetical protein